MADECLNLSAEMEEFIVEVCDKIGPRPPCSEAEKKGAEYYKEKINNYCDEIDIEPFLIRLGAYKAGFRLPMIFFIAALGLHMVSPMVSLLCMIISLYILFGKMILARPVIDFMFPQKSSQNVIAKIKPLSNNAKQLVIFGSHIDSNWEYPLFRMFGNRFTIFLIINVLVATVFSLFLVVENILIVVHNAEVLSGISQTAIWIFVLIGVPFALLQIFFLISNRPVMGANDNLSGMAVCYELAKTFSSPESRPESVEIWIAAFGCEETCSMGSKAFIEKHWEDIQNAKVIIFDTLGFDSDLHVHSAEISNIIKMTPEMVELVLESAREIEVPIVPKSVLFYTDSMSFIRKRITATALSSWPTSPKHFYYHTRYDIPENLAFVNLVNSYKVGVNLVKKLDHMNDCTAKSLF